ncbi:MAG: sensor histidine kinase [Desulfurivibrio sp.]|nr:MAG: sensor histidine kinase [Desulfurivibrio sp.]
MAGEIYESLHIISLVINRRQDIPLIRAKVKILAAAAGCPRLAVTQLAAAGSEMSRLLWQKYGGGKVDLAIIHSLEKDGRTGLELDLEGRKPFINLEDGSSADYLSADYIYEEFGRLAAVKGARSVLDQVVLARGMRGMRGMPVRIKCLKWGLGLAWEELQQVEDRIRKELFADTEESYVENLKVKHDEVIKLLKEKSARTRELDRVNAELLFLSRSLEEMAEERTMVEMSLRIADRIRNPATVIGGLARLLAGRSKGDDREKKRLLALKDQAEKLEAAVQDFDSLAARKKNLFRDEDLIEVVNEALSLCVTLSRKKIQPKVILPDKKVQVQANRRTLLIALLTIFRHAAAATAMGGEVIVKMTTSEDRPCITVWYTQTVSSETRRQENRNLTLNLASQIMAEHQGEVNFKGKEGLGALQSIEICLPLFWHEAGPLK